MPQFSVYQNLNTKSRELFPFMVEIQSNLLKDLPTTVVVPLCNPNSFGGKVITRLCPVIEFDGKQFMAVSPQLAGVERKILGKEVANVPNWRDALLASIDFILSGI
jgi:toxin CcdB